MSEKVEVRSESESADDLSKMSSHNQRETTQRPRLGKSQMSLITSSEGKLFRSLSAVTGLITNCEKNPPHVEVLCPKP